MRVINSGVVAASAMVLGGCLGIYGEISDLEGEAWVHESGAPAEVNSNDYGIGFAFGGSAGSGVKFLSFGQTPGGVALLSFDETGRLTSEGDPLPMGFDFVENPPTAGFPPAIGGGRNVAIGANDGAGQGGVLLYSPNGLVSELNVLNTAEGVNGVGIGISDAAAATAEVAATHGTNLTLFSALIEPGSTCGLVDAASANLIGGAVVMADFNSGGSDEIAVLAGNSLRIYTGTAIVSGAAGVLMTCGPPGATDGPAIVQIEAPSGEVDFGARMVSGDFNGDSTPDLALTAPSTATVYVILDPLGVATIIPVTANATSADFAAAIAAGDLDSDGSDELIIGAPESSVDGTSAAGQVEVHQLTGAAFAPPIIMRRAQPEANERYGRSLGVAAFNDTKDLLLVGADQKVFVNFRHPIDGDDDPRR